MASKLPSRFGQPVLPEYLPRPILHSLLSLPKCQSGMWEWVKVPRMRDSSEWETSRLALWKTYQVHRWAAKPLILFPMLHSTSWLTGHYAYQQNTIVCHRKLCGMGHNFEKFDLRDCKAVQMFLFAREAFRICPLYQCLTFWPIREPALLPANRTPFSVSWIWL